MSTDFSAIFAEHEATLRGIAQKLCGDSADAGDLLQDTFERALRYADRFEAQNPRAWLITIMRNLFLDRCRSQSRKPPVDPLDPDPLLLQPDPEPEPDWLSISTSQLKAAIERLDERFRQVFELHTFEGASYDEIAQRLNIPKATVGTRLARARQKIRELLSLQLEDDRQPDMEP